MSQDSHLRVGSHDISFKSHVKSLGVYIDATLSTAKRTDHISRSAYLEIRRISSVRHLLTRKATVQLISSFGLSRLGYCNSLLIDITSDQMYRLKKYQNHAAKVVFRKSKHVHVKPLLKNFSGSQSKKGYFSRSPPLPFVSLMVPCHRICHPVSLCTLHLVLSVPVPMKELFPVQNGISRALVTGRFLFRRP